MGAITLSFVYDPKTKQREVWLDYESAADWLPAEHERRHRELLNKLLAQGTLSSKEVERVRIRVEGEEVETSQQSAEMEEEDFAIKNREAAKSS